MSRGPSIATAARGLHHVAIALVFAAIVLAGLVFLSAVVLGGLATLLGGGDLGGHLPGLLGTVIMLMVVALDLALATWAGVWSFRLLQRPVRSDSDPAG
jgi:hypothetical protein